MKIHFYTAPVTIGVASHIALEESGLNYELHRVDFASKEQTSKNYLSINPKARVPSLIVDDIVLTETPAILVYIAQLAPTSALALPTDPMAFAQIQSFNSYLASTVHVAHAHRMRGSRWCDDESAKKAMQEFVPKSMHTCFDMIETSLLRGPWVTGGSFSICDVYLFAISSWLESDGVNAANFPKVQAHRESMLKRDSVQAALSLN